MSRTVTGTLLLPNGQPMANARIFFTAKRTEAVSIVEGVNAFFDTDNDGDYSQVIVDGWYSVSIEWQADAAGSTVRRWQLGNAVVEAGANTTLEALIIASSPAASVETTLLYEVLEKAQQARDDAEAAADAAAASAATISPTKQAQWDQAYSERNRWDGGSAGLNAATGRASLALGTASQANITTTSTDTTSGRVLRTGDAGWLGLNPTTENNANNITVAANYQLSTGTPASFSNFPSWAEPSRSTLLVMGNMSPYGMQMYFDRTLGRSAYRVYNGSFGDWRENWTTGNTSANVQSMLAAANNAAIRSAINASSLPPYTLGTVPSASANTNLLVVITDLAGGREPCFSNGTSWLRCSDKTIAN